MTIHFSALAVLSVALASCSHSTLERNVRPAAPPPQPGAGAAALGQPGEQRPTRMRSPHRRMLPGSWTPGLWSGDGAAPRAAVEAPSVAVLGVALPYPPLEEGEDAPMVTGMCGALISLAVEASGLKGRASALSPEERACLVARLYMHCTEELRQDSSDEREKQAAWRAQAYAAKPMKERYCSGAANSRAVGDLLAALKEQWDDLAKGD